LSSKKIFELVLRVQVLMMKESVQILGTHVSGKRMKAKGTDGTSSGHFTEGVTMGEKMIDFIPWNLSATKRTPLLLPWLRTWLGDDAEFLEPAGSWFTQGHNHSGGSRDSRGFWHHSIAPGHLVWTPPPAAADVALEEMRMAQIKRQDSTHYFICPCLLTPEWIKQLWKMAILFSKSP
jgi:hypothetical protein